MKETDQYCSLEDIASAIQEAGYKAEIEELQNGRKVIRSAASGSRFSVYTYGPADDLEKVQTIQFAYAVEKKVDPEEINKWNVEKRFGKAYLDEDGDLNLDWDIVVSYTTSEFLKECLNWWDLILGSLVEIPEAG
jgi:Putative bacterial sensory transduction regulator